MIRSNQKNTSSDNNHVRVTGGIPLSGKVKPDGAKNSALYVLVASTFITRGWMTVDNIPLITDVQMTLNILNELGMKYTIQNKSIKIYGKVNNTNISDNYASRIRSSTTFIGALLSQYGSVSVPLPGGDQIGKRPIDIHIDVFEAYGASVSINDGFVHAKLDTQALKGKDIYLRYPSVGATINAIFMAIKAKGKSTILNAAKEPEIVDLISMLNKMGAKIQGGGTDKIVVIGVNDLTATDYAIIPDRLETAALVLSFAITGGQGDVVDCIPEHNQTFIHLLKAIGINVKVDGDTISVHPSKPKKSFHIETQPYPGLATDLQAICTSLALICPNTSSIKDTVFEERFGHVNELYKMGASINKARNKISVNNRKLTTAHVHGKDIRSVVSLILTALTINDTCTIEGIDHLLRGHKNFISKLVSIGAIIESN